MGSDREAFVLCRSGIRVGLGMRVDVEAMFHTKSVSRRDLVVRLEVRIGARAQGGVRAIELCGFGGDGIDTRLDRSHRRDGEAAVSMVLSLQFGMGANGSSTG